MALSESGRAARDLGELGAHLNAAQVEFSLQCARCEGTIDWGDATVRSFAHYLAINCGLGLRYGAELLRVGLALETMPAIREAGLRGEISFDKARVVTRVATPEDNELWAGIARELSCSQLSRFCREYRLATAAEDPEHGRGRMARRGLWAYYQDDGMLRLVANLPPEDGAQVLATLRALTGNRLPVEDPGAADRDPAEDRWAARRADALMSMVEHAHGSQELLPPGARPQVVVHVDEAVLQGTRSDGRCEIEDGVPIDAGTAARLACDAELITVIERNGSPLDVGRARHRVPARLRRAVMARDRRCRFPGCTMPPARSQIHHMDWWNLGGSTDLGRLIALCKFHHQRLHQGAFLLEHGDDGRVDFLTRAGKPIRASEPHGIDPENGGAAYLRRRHQAQGIEVDDLTGACGVGHGFDPGWGVEVLLHNRRVAERGAADAPRTHKPEPPAPEPLSEAEDDAPLNLQALAEGLDGVDTDPAPDPHTDAVLRHMETARRACPDDLILQMHIPVGEVMVALTRLELAGKLERVAGGYALVGPSP